MSMKLAHIAALVFGVAILAFTATSYWISRSGHSQAAPTIALIPQTSGVMLWDGGRRGATEAAGRHNYQIYWNAPRSENDVEGQISLVDRVVRRKCKGLVLAPNH